MVPQVDVGKVRKSPVIITELLSCRHKKRRFKCSLRLVRIPLNVDNSDQLLIDVGYRQLLDLTQLQANL